MKKGSLTLPFQSGYVSFSFFIELARPSMLSRWAKPLPSPCSRSWEKVFFFSPLTRMVSKPSVEDVLSYSYLVESSIVNGCFIFSNASSISIDL